MSLVAIAMNVLLVVLLLAALGLGWRLDRRLRAVRDGQDAFAKAVADLDAAAGRAQSGLAELRAATDEAIDLLGGRIVRAREACDRLDLSIAKALAAPAPTAPPAPVIDHFTAHPRTGGGGLSALLARLEDSELLAEPVAEAAPEPAAPPRRRFPARPPIVDDELFVDGGFA